MVLLMDTEDHLNLVIKYYLPPWMFDPVGGQSQPQYPGISAQVYPPISGLRSLSHALGPPPREIYAAPSYVFWQNSAL